MQLADSKKPLVTRHQLDLAKRDQPAQTSQYLAKNTKRVGIGKALPQVNCSVELIFKAFSQCSLLEAMPKGFFETELN